MGIFSRLSDIVNANLNALLDRAEDPEKMAKLMIQEMEDTLVEVRSAAVKNISEKKEIQRRLEQLATAEADWAQKAEFAISKGRDDLAKGALLAKRKLGESATALQGELKAVEEALARHDEDLARLQSKLQEAKAKQKALLIRLNAAQKRVQVRRTLADGRVDDALARYETLHQKIDELEGRAEVYDMGQGKTLEQEFANLEAETGLDAELAALKEKLRAEHKG
ncbi:phage shock protein PspA [Dongia rigui]|uniref:Phage shock protein PspA n=1 Tax=Dongia rigui TaxID=940149 RepID=A0ABU5E0C5_9PROT|nr:phage shock protein PspA [Dongia rigui]MDY0873023.1 phage shock protein PspA [Dongia rigui]